MKLNEFIAQKTEKNEFPQETYLFDRCVVDQNGAIIVNENIDLNTLVEKKYIDLNTFKLAYSDFPDIEYAKIKNGKVFIDYGNPRFEKYCRHKEKIDVYIEIFDTGECKLLKKMCSQCGLEWKQN